MATTAFRSNTEMNDILPAVQQPTVSVAPPPPEDFDEVDVSLQSPSVWHREGIATVKADEPSTAALSPWERFSAWAKQHGWTGTAAACGLAAAALALAAVALTLIPRNRPVA